MNELLTIPKQKSTMKMSSREIAELCEKRHELVLRDIALLNEAYREIGYPIILETLYTHPQNGQTYRHCLLTQEQVLDLVTGYKPEIRVRINRRWQELEQQQAVRIPQNFAEALRLAADKAEEAEALRLENLQKSEENTALKAYFQAGLTPVQFVKGLNGVNSSKINAFLQLKGWLYKDKGEWRVFSHARDRYLTESFKRVAVDSVSRIELTTYKPILLENGAIKIFEDYMKGKLPMKADWDGKYHHRKVAA